MKLIIDIKEEYFNVIKRECSKRDTVPIGWVQIRDGIPLEEIPNPCIECSQNCCVCELNGENCECQKVYVLKEKNNGT